MLIYLYLQLFFFCMKQQQQSPAMNNETDQNGNHSVNNEVNNPDLDNLRKQLEDLQLVLHDKDSQIEQLKETSSPSPSNNSESFLQVSFK